MISVCCETQIRKPYDFSKYVLWPKKIAAYNFMCFCRAMFCSPLAVTKFNLFFVLKLVLYKSFEENNNSLAKERLQRESFQRKVRDFLSWWSTWYSRLNGATWWSHSAVVWWTGLCNYTFGGSRSIQSSWSYRGGCQRPSLWGLMLIAK